MFIVSLTYKKDINEVEIYIEEHLQFLDKYFAEKKFIFSGPKNPRTGGVILAHNIDKETLSKIIEQDPFYTNQIADFEITEVIPTKYVENFASFIE
ncbi:YciI family protein [Flavobacterium adhaerens]|uniref:YciI family protein n=1 Tax=Flavobacterium adhaerens TaxID=3149043 RepID=UPI0032B39357